jgi:hypothetical protein
VNEATFYRWQGTALLLQCQIQANSSQTAFAGTIDKRLKIRLQAPAIDGKANKALLAFLAKSFSCPKSSISIIKGESSKQKTVLLTKPNNIPTDVAIGDNSN